MIRHIAFLPFEIGMPLEGRLSELEIPGLEPTAATKQGATLSTDVRFWSDGGERVIALNHLGFGILATLVQQSSKPLNPNTVAMLLVRRAEFHRDAIAGTVEDVKSLIAIKDQIARQCSRAQGKRKRPDLWECVPYVVSLFFLQTETCFQDLQASAQRSVAALLEPSLVNCSDDAGAPDMSLVAQLVDELELGRTGGLCKDVDISPHVEVFMSWAGVVVLTQDGLELQESEELFRYLEVRTQLAWSMAHFCRLWCIHHQGKGKIPARVTSELRLRITPIVRQAVKMTQATSTTRFRQLSDALGQTSELSAEVGSAEVALADLTEFTEIQVLSSRRKYERAVAIALFILTSSQVLPVFFHEPIYSVRMTPLVIATMGVVGAVAVFAIARGT